LEQKLEKSNESVIEYLIPKVGHSEIPLRHNAERFSAAWPQLVPACSVRPVGVENRAILVQVLNRYFHIGNRSITIVADFALDVHVLTIQVAFDVFESEFGKCSLLLDVLLVERLPDSIA